MKCIFTFLLLWSALVFQGGAAAQTLSGPFCVAPAQTAVYETTPPRPNESQWWEVSGGTLLQQTETSATIQWSASAPLSGFVRLWVDYPYGSYVADEKSVQISTISGPVQVAAGSEQTYTHTTMPQPNESYWWKVTGGSLVQWDQTQATVRWEGVGARLELWQDNPGGTMFWDEIAVQVSSQRTFEYTYDASGNRIRREVIVLEPPVQNRGQAAPAEKLATTATEFRVYPNPVETTLNFVIHGQMPENPVQLLLYDLTGRQLLAEETAVGSYEIDMSAMAHGTYVLRAHNGAKTQEWKIIKQ